MDRMLGALIGFLPAFGLALFIWPLVARALKNVGCVGANYKGATVVNCAGLLLPIVFVAQGAICALFFPAYAAAITPLLILVLGASLFGMIDDVFGSQGDKGLRGHFGHLLGGNLTTGSLKALGTGAIAIFASGMRSNRFDLMLLDAALIALCANAVNLLDLRPGRALKAFVFVGAVLAMAVPPPQSAGLLASLAVALVLIKPDLKEKVMLGDVGSNAFGAVIGAVFVFNFKWQFRLVAVALLAAVHVYAERRSITDLISKAPFLRALDELGREKG